MEKQKPANVIVRCPKCEWRIFDKVTPTSGSIAVKCTRCENIVLIDLSLRKTVRYRVADPRLIRIPTGAHI